MHINSIANRYSITTMPSTVIIYITSRIHASFVTNDTQKKHNSQIKTTFNLEYSGHLTNEHSAYNSIDRYRTKPLTIYSIPQQHTVHHTQTITIYNINQTQYFHTIYIHIRNYAIKRQYTEPRYR